MLFSPPTWFHQLLQRTSKKQETSDRKAAITGRYVICIMGEFFEQLQGISCIYSINVMNVQLGLLTRGIRFPEPPWIKKKKWVIKPAQFAHILQSRGLSEACQSCRQTRVVSANLRSSSGGDGSTASDAFGGLGLGQSCLNIGLGDPR